MKIEKINRWFARRGEWIVKRRWVVIIGFIALFAAGFYGLRFMKINDSWKSYFLEDDPVLLKTEEFKAIFGNDNYTTISQQRRAARQVWGENSVISHALQCWVCSLTTAPSWGGYFSF